MYDALPVIESWDHQATKLVPGSMFKGSGSIRLCLADMKSCDGLGGWVLARLIEAQKYFEGRRLNVWQGDCNMSFDEMVKSTFFMDRVTGPDKNCGVCLEASDPTSLIGFDKAVCPPSKNLVDVIYQQPVQLTLGVPLQKGPTVEKPNLNPDQYVGNFILSNNFLPDNDGPTDRCFLDTKYLCAGKEMMHVIPCINEDANPVPGWNFKLVERAVCGSTLVEHKNGDRVEIVKHFENMHASDVIRCLIQDCANFDQVTETCCEGEPESFLSEYFLQEYKCKRPSDVITDVKFCEVQDVGDLLECMAKELNISIYFDDFCQQIVVKAYCPPEDDDVNILTAEEIIKDSFNVKPTDERYSSVTYNHDLVDCTIGPKAGNYRCHVVNQNIDALREPCDRRTYKTTKDLVVNTKWINGGNAYLANVNTLRWAERAVCPPRQIEVDVLPETSRCYAMGQITKIEHEKVSMGGEYSKSLWMFTGRKMLKDCVRLCFIETPWTSGLYSNSFNCDTLPTRPTDLCELEQCERVW